MKQIGWFVVIAGAVIFELITAPITGFSSDSWKLSRSQSSEMVRFQLQHSSNGDRTVSGSDVPVANFHSFSPTMLEHSGPLKFEYVQDAGRLVCQGRVAWGRGSGSFTFTPNPEFTAELNRLGFGSPRQDELYTLLLTNVNLEFARAIHDAGIGTSVQQLIELRSHGITAQYVDDVRRAGYTNLRAQDFIELQSHGVNRNFLLALKSAGYNLRTEEIVELHSHGVGPRFLEDLKRAGYDLSADQITELSSHGVNSGFVRDIALTGVRPAATELVQLHEHGVTPDYLRHLEMAGYGKLSVEDVVRLRQNGVPGDFVLEARDVGYRFTAGEFINLHSHGVDGRYLKHLHDSGIRDLTATQITELHAHGVE